MTARRYLLHALALDEDIPLTRAVSPITVHTREHAAQPRALPWWAATLTSQRVTDGAVAGLRACASSQGCMNNLTFGDDTLAKRPSPWRWRPTWLAQRRP